MPCRVSSDVHERINELPTVPTTYPLNPQYGEQSVTKLREEKTLWSFTAAYSDILVLMQSIVSSGEAVIAVIAEHNWNTNLQYQYV